MKTRHALFAVCTSLALGGAMLTLGCDDTASVDMMPATVHRDLAVVIAPPDMATEQNTAPDLGCYGPATANSTAYQIMNACPNYGDPSGVTASPSLPRLLDGGVLPPLP